MKLDAHTVDKIQHHLETVGNHGALVFTRESSFLGFLGGAKWFSPIHSIASRQVVGSMLTIYTRSCQDRVCIGDTVLSVNGVADKDKAPGRLVV